MLVFGNLVDNLRGRHKQMIIFLEICFAVINIVEAAIESKYFDDPEISEFHNNLHKLIR